MTSRILSICAKKPFLTTCVLSDARVYFHQSAASCNLKKKTASSDKMQDKFRKSDKVPDHWKLVYRAPEQYLDTTHHCGQFTAIACLVGGPVLLSKSLFMQGGFVGNFTMTQGSFEMWGFFFLIVLHSLAALRFTQITPVRIYFEDESDQFYFVYNDIKHFKKKIIEIVLPGELQHCPKESDIWNLNAARHRIERAGRRLLFMLPFYFRSPFYYRKLTGTNFDDYDRDSKYA